MGLIAELIGMVNMAIATTRLPDNNDMLNKETMITAIVGIQHNRLLTVIMMTLKDKIFSLLSFVAVTVPIVFTSLIMLFACLIMFTYKTKITIMIIVIKLLVIKEESIFSKDVWDVKNDKQMAFD